MQEDGRPVRSGRDVLALCMLAAGLAGGCSDRRTLSWTYATDTPHRIESAGRVAVVQESPGRYPAGMRTIAEEMSTALAAELIGRGLRVTMLRDPTGGPAQTQPAATSGPAAPPPPNSPRPVMPADLVARYTAARQAQADLLLELSAAALEKLSVSAFSIPFAQERVSMSGRTLIQQASLRVSDPATQTLIATVTVQYDDPHDGLTDVCKDLCLGLDCIRKGMKAQNLLLKGPPGKVK